jgi:8-oxo-dGTP pyrophosphatase MutT (NUDIX family)
MCRWLDGSRESKIPPFASHQVGVCGVVLREDTQEILVTQDKYKPARWKFPGGISEFAEKISDTAEREVLEETGIVASKSLNEYFMNIHPVIPL